jgi:hypothetical protein
MSVDYQESLDVILNKIKANQTYIQVQADVKNAQLQQRDNLARDLKNVKSTLDDLKNNSKRYQRQVTSQLDNLIYLVKANKGSGSATAQYLKLKFIQTAIKIEPLIYKILTEETIKTLGCSQQQTYTPQSIYIKVSSVDFLKLLKDSPYEEYIRPAYEKLPPTPFQKPYSMNWQMWERLQNLNVPVDIYGASGQKLFTITYVNFDGSITGDFFKIDLVNKTIGQNKVVNFITDYYKSIQIIDLTNIFQHLMDMISNAISFEAKWGYGELQEKNKFLLILQRILGLCFDNTREIDVSGISKLAELDIIDDSFYEFTEIDLRNIDEKIWDTQNGVIEFEDCQTVKFPVNNKDIIDSLNTLKNIVKVEDQEKYIANLTNVITDNPEWKELIPNITDINLSVDLSFLLNLPKAIMMALLSPKVVLPILVMSKAIGQLTGYTINGFMDFFKSYIKFNINVMSKIGGIFIEELAQLIGKDIQNLLASVAFDLTKEQATKKYSIIVRLVQLLLYVIKFVQDWRRCKSVVDEILGMFNVIRAQFNNQIPLPLLGAVRLLDGYSANRAMVNVIEEYQKLGIRTEPMSDGSPNNWLLQTQSILKGQAREYYENGATQMLIEPLTVTPTGQTLPKRGWGKTF